MRRNTVRRIWVLLLPAALVAAACGGGASEEPAAPEEAPGAAQEAEGTAEKAAPATESEIDGLYFNGISVLKLETGTWDLVSQTLALSGNAEVSDGQVVLSGEASCPDTGTYSWSAAGNALTLEAMEDSCPGRSVIVSGSWGPIQPLGEKVRKGDYLVLEDLHFAGYFGEQDVSGQTSAEIDVMVRDGAHSGAWVFSPTLLVASPGQELELTIRNPRGKGIVPFGHNFSLPEQDISVDIPSGGEATVTVTFPEEGALTFYCFYHLENGQGGALVAA